MKKLIYTIITLIALLSISVLVLEKFSNYKTSTAIHSEAPVITRKTITINAPVETVWKVFSDVNNWSTWQKEISEARINGPFAAGTTFDWKSNGLTIHSSLQTVEVNKRIGWSGPAFGSFAIHTWNFIERDGQTEVRVDESMEGWLVSLLKGVFQSGLDTSIDHWLSDLKAQAEKVR